MDTHRPIQICRDEEVATVAASIWLRRTRAGVFYDVTVARAYPKSQDEAGYAGTFSDRHLDALIRVLTRAKTYIHEKKAAAVTVTLNGERTPDGETIGDRSAE